MVSIICSEKLRQRVAGLSQIESSLSLSLDEVLDSYTGTSFTDSSLDKGIFFRECLALELSQNSESLITERCKFDFHRDSRSSIEYALDLVFGWLSEDLVLQVLRKNDISVKLAGEDQHREFLPSNEIGTSSDLSIEIDGKIRQLEIVFSWNNYWTTSDSWDIRASKFQHLTRQGIESLCLGIEVPSLLGFLIDMRRFRKSFVQRPNPAWGNKNVYTLRNIRNKLREVDQVLVELNQI